MIRVVEGDLADLLVDAVVRPADHLLAPAGAASTRLDRRAGEQFTEQCQVQTPLEVGAAVVTGAGNLSAKFVVHVVIQSPDRPPAPDTIRRALLSAWHRAEVWALQRVATPLVGLDAESLDAAAATRLLAETFLARPRTTGYPAELQIAVDAAQRAAVERALPSAT